MGMGKRGQGGSKTTWFDLRGKEGVLTTWNRETRSEDEYGYVFGRLEDVRVKERMYGDQKGYVVNSTLRDTDSGERIIVSCSAGSRVTCRLLGQFNAADLSRPIYVAPYLMRKGDEITDHGTGGKKVLEEDTSMTAVKYVLSINDGQLKLSDGIRPFYNDAYGDRLPSPVPVVVNGKPLFQGGRPVMDRSEIEALTIELVTTLSTKIAALNQGHGHAQGADDSVDPEQATAAAATADRSAMRARG